MQGPVQTMLSCEWANATGQLCDDPVVIDWLNRINMNGIPLPSEDTIRAVCDFCTALRVDGIMDKMLVVNPIIPDSFLAMRYPLIYQVGNGNSPFINFNFVAADLNNDGLQGRGGLPATSFDTGFIPSSHWLDTPSAGITAYESEISITGFLDETDVGCYSLLPTQRDTFLRCYDNANSTDGEGWTLVTSLCTAVKADTPSLYSWNRTSDVLANLYMNNNPVAIATNNFDQSLASVPDKSVYFMAFNDNGISNFSTGRRISFMAIHEGLTAAEVGFLYAAVYDLRAALGGGYVP